ncbi:MAG: AAA family ATPase [Saprospiraceae bacterium]
MYIKKVTIDNIRSISHFEMEFPQPAGWHVLIGDNGAGKSSVVRAIAAALIGPEEIGGVLPIWSEWLREGALTGKFELEILQDRSVDIAGRGQPAKNKNIINLFSLSKDNDRYVSLTTNANANTISPLNYNWSVNKGWFSVAYGPFRRFTGGDEKRNRVYLAYPKKAGPHLSVFGEDIALTEALNWLKELDRKRIKQTQSVQSNQVEESNVAYRNESEVLFQSIKSFINKSGLLPHGAQFDSVDLDGDVVFKDGNGNPVKVTQMSDGYRSILSLMFELIRQLVDNYGADMVFANLKTDAMEAIFIPVPGVVLIDEIDAHLHPTWQTRIGQWFTQYFPNIQFIVTSHSPLVCRACEKGSIWRLAAPGSGHESGEITGVEKERLVFGNILDAYGTEVFGQSPVRSEKSNEKLERLGKLNMLSAFGKISSEEETERQELQQIFPTDAPII